MIKRFFLLFASSLLASLLLMSCQESLEQLATRTLKEYTRKNCPQQMGETVVMDSCRFESDTHTLHYFYRFQGAMDNDSVLNPGQMRQMLVDALRNETSTRIFKDEGYRFQYTYRSDSHPDRVLFEATLTKEDYE